MKHDTPRIEDPRFLHLATGFLPYTCRSQSVWCDLRGPVAHCPVSDLCTQCLFHGGNWEPGRFRPSRSEHAPHVTSSVSACETSSLLHSQTRSQRTVCWGSGNKNEAPQGRGSWWLSQTRASLSAPSLYPHPHLQAPFWWPSLRRLVWYVSVPPSGLWRSSRDLWPAAVQTDPMSPVESLFHWMSEMQELLYFKAKYVINYC